MNMTKAITGMMSVVALTAVAAGSSMASTLGEFDFTTVFTPNPINSTGGFGNFITVLNNSALNQMTPSQITLSNFVESSTTPSTGSNAVNVNYDVALTVTPNGGTPQTKDFLGNITGSFNNGISNLVETSTTPSLTYDFGSLGSYTFNNVTFVAPGITTSTVPGSLGASVTFAPAAQVPEPATVAPFVLGGLGLMGLAFRARKTRRTNGAAA